MNTIYIEKETKTPDGYRVSMKKNIYGSYMLYVSGKWVITLSHQEEKAIEEFDFYSKFTKDKILYMTSSEYLKRKSTKFEVKVLKIGAWRS